MQKDCQLPHYIAFTILEVSYFWFMTGKSSWVHSRTQGSIPMLFCRWSNVLWLLHPLSVPSHGWWLDQGRWSLRLLFCFCGNDRIMALYQTKCVWCIFKLWGFRYLWTWFVITLRTPMYFKNVVIWMYLWMATVELITILAVCTICGLKSFEISRTTGIIWA